MAKTSLDLHGFTTDEVYDAVDAFIVGLQGTNVKQAKIITGKGTGAVQKKVIEYLKHARYQWSFEKLKNGQQNTGVLLIHLN